MVGFEDYINILKPPPRTPKLSSRREQHRPHPPQPQPLSTAAKAQSAGLHSTASRHPGVATVKTPQGQAGDTRAPSHWPTVGRLRDSQLQPQQVAHLLASWNSGAPGLGNTLLYSVLISGDLLFPTVSDPCQQQREL